MAEVTFISHVKSEIQVFGKKTTNSKCLHLACEHGWQQNIFTFYTCILYSAVYFLHATVNKSLYLIMYYKSPVKKKKKLKRYSL